MEIIRRKITFKKFISSLIIVLMFATPITIFTNYLYGIVEGLFLQTLKIENYAGLLPLSPRERPEFLSKGRFIVFGLFSVFLYFLFSYLCESQAERLIIKINSYIKNRLLGKFRNLKFEARITKKKEINNLAEIESNLVAKH